MAQKLLILPRYSKLGASSRYRFYDYLEYLDKEGIDYTISSLFTNKYLIQTYSKSFRVLEVIKCYWNNLHFISCVNAR